MLEARDIHFAYRQTLPILAGVSLTIHSGQIVGVSGPSGGGKSTLGRILAAHLLPDAGSVRVDGKPYAGGWSPVQYVHQSAIQAVNPRWRIGRIVEEGWEPDDATRAALGVSHTWYDRYPHEISGGQLQRITLLRALSPQTRFLVADELTTMLDPITQSSIWRFLRTQCQNGLGIMAISHDLALLERIATQSAVLRNAGGGRWVDLSCRV